MSLRSIQLKASSKGRVALGLVGRHQLTAPLRSRSSLLTAVDRTAFSFETQRILKTVLTRQALKTLLTYLEETNGELHFWLGSHVAAHPLPLDGRVDADEWIVDLAATPLTKVQDPRRSSTVGPAAAAAVLDGVREVSPREVAERLMSLRAHIALEMQEGLLAVPSDHSAIMRKVLDRTFLR